MCKSVADLEIRQRVCTIYYIKKFDNLGFFESGRVGFFIGYFFPFFLDFLD